MSLGNCIPGMVKRGEIGATRGARMKALFDELEGFYGRSMGAEAAAAEASEATLRQLAAEQRLKKRQTLLQINRQREAVKDVDRFNGKNPYKAVAALFDDDDRAPYRGGNVTTNAKRIEYQAHGAIEEFIERHSRNLLGRPRDRATLDNVVRELHGQASGDEAAKTMAGAIGGTFEQLRQRFNAAGGAIGKLKGFGLPHRHDPQKVRAVSADEWIAEVMPALDRAAMIDSRTGVAMTDQALTEMLAGVHETIRTNGLTGDPSGMLRGAGKLANQRAEHRILHFADGDAWLGYNAKFGAADDPFAAILGHISSMSKDIAMMERLGPNPGATVRYMLDRADRQRAQSGDARVAAVEGRSGGRKSAEDLWHYVNGETSVAVVPESALGRGAVETVHAARNWNVASMLGSATLTALSDTQTAVSARLFYGLPVVKSMAAYFKMFVPRSAEDVALARRLGAGMDQAARSMRSMQRLFGESRGPNWTQVMADDVLRVTGLNLWTEKGQDLFVTDFLGHLGAMRDRPWKDLPGDLRAAMERNGLDQFDWTAIRHSEPIMSGGDAYIDHAAIVDRGVSDRLMNMVLRGRAAAVIESSPSAQVVATLGTQGGTLGGELVRNSFQFKTFAIQLALKQFRQMALMNPKQRALYAAQMVIGMTLFGAMSIQLRELLKGRDPRPMDNADFWTSAMFQGGGIGIAGDLTSLMMGVYKGDRIDSVGQFVGGPIWSMPVDAVQAAARAMPHETKSGRAVDGDPGGAAVQLARRHMPGGNAWFARAAFDRLIMDQLEEMAGNDVEQRRARSAKAIEQNRQGQWWKPGEVVPGRAPDLGNALRTDAP
ncbi:MAG: hypothetical protein P0Y64_02110 [Candidatus Sphingomonas colombiensis]|nr:hypothetical protein [Sphingomonas sp.]WEK43650.1 MAG: hypothetical protein P0Y64_02110 [Sphingomonas sp.]